MCLSFFHKRFFFGVLIFYFFAAHFWFFCLSFLVIGFLRRRLSFVVRLTLSVIWFIGLFGWLLPVAWFLLYSFSFLRKICINRMKFIWLFYCGWCVCPVHSEIQINLTIFVHSSFVALLSDFVELWLAFCLHCLHWVVFDLFMIVAQIIHSNGAHNIVEHDTSSSMTLFFWFCFCRI